MSIETQRLSVPSPTASRIIAVFAFRDDAALVPAMLANIAPLVHGWAAWDDRDAGRSPSTEPQRRMALLRAAADLEADWVLAIDPDERFDRALTGRIAAMTAPGVNVLWTFPLREMHGPNVYRSDALWAKKAVLRLFPAASAAPAADMALHGSWVADRNRPPVRSAGVALYHLRMMTPARRRLRRDTYALADPERRFQPIGYDYLDDPRGQVLTPLAPGEGFDPPHDEDGGLWAPALPPDAVTLPDPLAARLRFARNSRATGGGLQAGGLLADAAAMAPDDPDLALLTADALMRGGDAAGAGDWLQQIVARWPDQAVAHLLLARLWRRQGDDAGAAAAAACAATLVPGSLLVRQEVQRNRPMPGRVLAADALWRRWCDGPAIISEGAQVAVARIAVVVIGLHAPPTLAQAVASVRAQSAPAEIVVVNSGGGDVRAVLGGHLAYVRLIEIEGRLFVGAARNIGIDASAAPVVAFLADDCIARPGWIAARLAHHAAGADAVTSAVIPAQPRNPFALASNALLYGGRWPEAPALDWTAYGLSYARHLFDDHGHFPPGLRVGEDTVFNRRLLGSDRVAWAPEVQTAHSDPLTPAAFWRDLVRRARRRLAVPPHDSLPDRPDAAEAIARLSRQRGDAACAALGLRPDLGPFRRWLAGRIVRIGCRIEARAMRAALAAVGPAPAPGMEETGVDALRAAVAAHPRNGRAWIRLADALMRQAEGDAPDPALVAEAETALGRAANLLPESHEPVERLATLLLRQGKADRAADMAEMAALSAPQQRYLWLAAQRAVVKTRDFARVRLVVQAGLIADPGFATMHRLAGQVNGLLGHTDIARARTETAAELDRSDPARMAQPG